jgi:hypothetical protein
LKKILPFEFQKWVMEKLYARDSPRRSGDLGIEGYYIDGSPIQGKQSEHVGRNVVDNFESAIGILILWRSCLYGCNITMVNNS